jgi:hypothetical protein
MIADHYLIGIAAGDEECSCRYHAPSILHHLLAIALNGMEGAS